MIYANRLRYVDFLSPKREGEMRKVLAVTVALILLVGCASTETVRQSKGQGAKNLYNAAIENVYAATLRAARSEKLEIVAADKNAGRIDLAHGRSVFRNQRRQVDVFVFPLCFQRTRKAPPGRRGQ